jgi:hypothetical protein
VKDVFVTLTHVTEVSADNYRRYWAFKFLTLDNEHCVTCVRRNNTSRHVCVDDCLFYRTEQSNDNFAAIYS